MKFLFILLLFSTSIYSKYLSISPEFVINYSSDDEQYAYSNAEIKEFEFCFLTSYNKNKINIISKTGYHFIDGLVEFPSSFTMKQGLFGLENPPGLGNKQRNYYISDMKIEYGDSTFQFYLYKWDKHWGPGKNSILLSNCLM